MTSDKYGYNKPSPLSEKEQEKERARRRKVEEEMGRGMKQEIVHECEKEFGNPKPAYFVGFDKMQVNACVRGASIGLQRAGIVMPYLTARETKEK